MLKRLMYAAIAVILSASVTTNAYAAESILNSISAGAGKKVSVSSDNGGKPSETDADKKPETKAKSNSDAMVILEAPVEEEKGEDVSEDSSGSETDGEESTEASDDENSPVEATGLCVANVDDLMNVRAEASEDAKVVGYMYKDCVGEIIENGDGWTKIRSGNLEGWAKNDFLLFGEEADQKTEGLLREVAVINADALRIRAEASEDAEVKAMLAEGDEVEVIDLEGDDWVKISFEDGTSGEDEGYVASEFVSIKITYKTGETIEEVKDREEKSKAAKEEAAKKEKAKKDSSDSGKAAASDGGKATVTNGASVAASVDDETLLAALIQCECNGPYDAQLAVGAVVVNRAKSGYGSISNAIYAPHQFGPASSGKLAATLSTGAISGTARQAAKDAISGVSNVGNAKYFRNVKSGHEGIVIGNHVYW